MNEQARAKINFKTGEIELEGSEQFVQSQLENMDTIVDFMALLASGSQNGLQNSIEEEELEIVAEEEQEKLASSGEQNLEIPPTFGEWLHKFKDELTDSDEALLTAYYVQKQSPQNDFKTSEVNKSLQEHGIKLVNPSHTLTRLTVKKLLFQTRKDGKLRYMRVSADGVKCLESLLR